MKLTAIGVASNSCESCRDLKKNLLRDFGREGFELDFVEIVYEEDNKQAMKIASDFGLNNIPSFSICGVVFGQYYGSSNIKKAIESAKRGNKLKTKV